MTVDQLNSISGQIVDAALLIHRELGPGLLESVYEIVLAAELRQRGYKAERQVKVPVEFRGIKFDEGYRIDILIEDAIVIEVKSVEEVTKVHKKQLLTYLRLNDKRLGLLLNFNTELMKDGIHRIANGMPEN